MTPHSAAAMKRGCFAISSRGRPPCRSAAAGFQQTSETLEEAAQNLGCPPLKAVIKITLPLILANLIAGGLLAFAFAMLEVSDSLILAQKQVYYPITKAIYELFQLLGDGKLYVSNLEGETFVLAAGPKFRLLARNDLKEPIYAAPAASGEDGRRAVELCLKAQESVLSGAPVAV